MADAVVWVNGVEVAAHADGYTPFEARLTGQLQPRRQPGHRPHRRQREPGDPAVRRPDRLSDLCRHLPRRLAADDGPGLDRQRQGRDRRRSRRRALSDGRRRIRNAGEAGGAHGDGAPCRSGRGGDRSPHRRPRTATAVRSAFTALAGIRLWDIDRPGALHDGGDAREPRRQRPGRRTVSASAAPSSRRTGFFLNGRPLEAPRAEPPPGLPLRRATRMGRRAQERDAEILKHDLELQRRPHLALPAVAAGSSTTATDRAAGLRGDPRLAAHRRRGVEGRAVENVGAMIRRDWNHPSIVLWGVRINEIQRRPRLLRRDQPPRPRARPDAADRRRALHHRERAARGRLHHERLRARRARSCRAATAAGCRCARGPR